MDEPTVELVESENGPYWRVCGLGYCTEHQQRWQAEVLFECLKVAKCLNSEVSRPPSQ